MTQPLEQRLKAYQRRINELQSTSSFPLDPDRLRALAADFDLSDEDLAAADDIAYASFQSGESLLTTGEYDKALDAFADAVALRPDWLQYRAALARAYLYRYESYGRDHDRYRVIELTQDCLEVEAGYRPAVEIINRLNARQAQQGAEQVSPDEWTEQAPPIPAAQEAQEGGKSPLGCMLMLMIFGAFTFCCCFSSDSEEYEDLDESVQVLENEPVAVPALDPDLANMLEAIDSAKPVDVAFLGVPPGPLDRTGRVGKGSYGLRVMKVAKESSAVHAEVVRSKLKVYGPNNAYYEIWLQIRNDSDMEVEVLPLHVTVFGHDNVELVSKDSKALSKVFSPVLRPGDVTGQRRLIKTDARAASASFELGEATLKQPPSSYEASTPFAAEWSGKASESGELLGLSVRSQGYKDSSLEKGKGYFNVEFEVTNRSDRPISKILSKLHVRDASGAVVDTQDWYLIGSLYMPILAGQTRVVRRTFGVPDTYASFGLEVVDLQLDTSE